ncbi:MAG: PDDEXK nuclease domain-containing protein [Chitinophagaceae bacterium]
MKIIRRPHGRLLKEIRQLVEQARHNVIRHINTELLITYWNVGRLIVEYEQAGSKRAEYGKELLIDLSKSLTRELGKGFSRSQLQMMRLFYLRFQLSNEPIRLTVSGKLANQKSLTVSGKFKKTRKRSLQGKAKMVKPLSKQPLKQKNLTVSHLLNWSHYYELLMCNDEMEIGFYQRTAINENWSVRELRRQIDTALFERIALSKKPGEVKRLAAKGHRIEKETDIARDPYVLEFLNIPEHHSYTEKQLEQKIIDNLQKFILELGKGFSFVARQFRITLSNKHYRVDLVFYHRVLRCFVLIDLKIKSVEHSDIGQMNLYLNYFETEQNAENDNPPVGIILSKHKDDVTVEYAIRGITNKIFVSKYQLYLPDKRILKKKITALLEMKR